MDTVHKGENTSGGSDDLGVVGSEQRSAAFTVAHRIADVHLGALGIAGQDRTGHGRVLCIQAASRKSGSVGRRFRQEPRLVADHTITNRWRRRNDYIYQNLSAILSKPITV